jgi:hypothetical protein
MIETLRQQKWELITSEYAKKWTETSPNSKLWNIKMILNEQWIQRIKEIKILKEKIRNREYRDFQKIIKIPYNKCDWKLWWESLNYLNNYISKLKQQNNIISQTNNNLSNLQQSIWQIENQIDTINIQHNEVQYLQSHETLNEGEYNKLFSWKEKLQQWQFGDCYLVSWINELARAQHFDTLMRTSIQRMKRNNWDMWYQIKIPLWEPSWRKILLKDSELSVAKIRWNTWYKLLELAYAKNKLRKNDRTGNRYYPITPWEFSKIRWWRTKEVLETFLWKQNISFNTFWDKNRAKPLNRVSTNEKNQITWFLKNYVPGIWNKFLSLSSIWWSDTQWYKVWESTIYHWHAYSITWINKDKKGEIKSITLLNPRNNKRGPWHQYQNITLNDFFNWFSYMSYGKIKTNTFLNDKSV